MGTAMAEQVLDAGFRLLVFNRTPQKAASLAARGAEVAASAGDLAARVDVVLTSLSNDEAAGVTRIDLLEVMGSSAAGAPFVKYKTEPLVNDDFSATFTTALMEKDIDLILDAAAEHGAQLPMARELKTLLRAASEAGYADDDFIALFLYLRGASRYRDQEVVR